MAKITVQNIQIAIMSKDGNDYVSLTDIAKYKSDDPTMVVANWMRNRNTIEYLGIWERLYNPDFNPTEFEGVKKRGGAQCLYPFAAKMDNTIQNDIIQPYNIERNHVRHINRCLRANNK